MKLGKIEIQNAVLLAPMENVTDRSFRLICRQLGADIVYTEFVNAEGLVRRNEKTKSKMTFDEAERPIGIQIYGSNAVSMREAALMADELQPDLIDINGGCWIRNVVAQGAGAGLLRDLSKMYNVIESVVKVINKPVTVKTRLGWDEKSIRIIDVAKIVESAGAQLLTIHCRTRSQGQKGKPDYSWIPKVKEAVKIPIVVNGGISSGEIAKDVFDTTGCDGIMIGSGAMQNPWIFREIKYFLESGRKLPKPSVEDRIKLLLDHLKLSVSLKGEPRGVLEFRKYYSGYLKYESGISHLRTELMQFESLGSITDRLQKYLDSWCREKMPETPVAISPTPESDC